MKTTYKKITTIILFAIAMGFLEAAVVIYLRALYYPNGFQFPLKTMDQNLAMVEILRELATVIMLIGVASLAGRNRLQSFAYFNLAFAVWDLFYYVFLFLCLQWPSSLFTWDILFLIPLPWIGPVWAPCLLCLLMVIGSVIVIVRVEKSPSFVVHKIQWWMVIAGACICILSFLWDYLMYCNLQNLWLPGNKEAMFADLQNYQPQSFNHILFFTGFAFMSWPVIQFQLFTKKNNHYEKK